VALAVFAAVERAGRAAELAALRVQGVGDRVLRAVLLGGYPAMVLLFGGLGVAVAALASSRLAGLPTFVDDWSVLRPPPSVDPVALAAVATAAMLALAVVAGHGVRRLYRAVRTAGGWSA
jgi:hypothetical protein